MLAYFPLNSTNKHQAVFFFVPVCSYACIPGLTLTGKTHPVAGEMLESLRIIIACGYTGLKRVFFPITGQLSVQFITKDGAGAIILECVCQLKNLRTPVLEGQPPTKYGGLLLCKHTQP